MKRTLARYGAVAAVGMSFVLPPAVAQADDDVTRRGSCNGVSKWEFELEKDDGRIEVEYEVTTRREGHRWRVRIWHDGDRVFKGIRVARRDDDDRPDFEVELNRPDRRGTDRFKARAYNTKTGELCRGAAAI